MCGKPWMRSSWRAGTDAAAAGRSPTPSTRTRPVLGGPLPAARLARVVSVVSRTVALVTRTSRQRPATLQPDVDEDVLKLEFDNRWEGPGDAFQTIVGSMAGLEVHVTPADGGPSFDALLVVGNREYEDSDVDNAALVQVQRVDDLCDPVGEPEYVRVKRLRVSS